MVVAHSHQHTAKRAGSGHVRMAHHVARPVHARPLAVPQPEHAVELAFTAQLGLLRAPEGGGCEVFVQAPLKGNIVFCQWLGGLIHLHIDRAQGRSAIAGDQTRRVMSRCPIALLLHQHQAHKRLRAIKQNRAFAQVETVI